MRISHMIAGASVGAFVLAELGIGNTWGWQPSVLSALYLVLLSLAVEIFAQAR